MTNHVKENSSKDWRKKLRSVIITALTGTPQEQCAAVLEIGYYYTHYAPASLYKYYSDKQINLEAVKNGQMWFSAPCCFNDVFDCDVFVDEKGIFNCALQMLPDPRGIHAGSQVWHQLKKTVNKEIRSLRDTFEQMKMTTGISCLSELDDSLLMWAHYASNHSGMCVEYDLLEINKQLGFSPVPVIYSNDRASFNSIHEATIDADTTGVLIESLTSKSLEWGYEKEWRIIRDDGACGDKWDSENKGALLDMIRPNSIILGCMIKPDYEKAVLEYCEANRINLYKMEKSKDQYRLEKVSVLQFEE